MDVETGGAKNNAAFPGASREDGEVDSQLAVRARRAVTAGRARESHFPYADGSS